MMKRHVLAPLAVRRSVTLCLAALSFACALSFSSTAVARHPFHMSTAYIEISQETGKLEIALKIHGDDLQVGLSAVAGKKVSIDETGKANRFIEKYMNQHFVFGVTEKEILTPDREQKKKKAAEKTPAPIQVIGTEFTKSWLWVYCEMELPKEVQESSSDKVYLRNTLLVDRVEAQINTVQFRNTNGRHAVRTSAAKPVVELKAEWLDRKLAIPAGDQKSLK